jgi:hypothetical protein
MVNTSGSILISLEFTVGAEWEMQGGHIDSLIKPFKPQQYSLYQCTRSFCLVINGLKKTKKNRNILKAGYI